MTNLVTRLRLLFVPLVAAALGTSGLSCDPNSCSQEAFECLSGGTARKCGSQGTWSGTISCPLGCEGTSESCFVPSNIPLDHRETVLNPNLQPLDLLGAQSPVTINTDDGSITDSQGNIIRPAGALGSNGIAFTIQHQLDGATPAAIFVMRSLNIPPGTELVATGSNPLILYVQEGADIHGIIDVGARQDDTPNNIEGFNVPGPGGFAGGTAGQPGQGQCAGSPGDGIACGVYTTSGGGGGGHAGIGGEGGDGSDPWSGCNDVYEGGPGGGVCGNAEMTPLVGGSGGGVGGEAVGDSSVPGDGGAGGGAIQISALQYIHVYPDGVITAPGGGGGGATNRGGGGGGGGAGGVILLESANVILENGSVIAANGGGGGGSAQS